MLIVLQALALAGFIASVAVHISALSGIAAAPYVYGLHAGIFVVLVPAALLQKRLVISGDRSKIWSELLRGCPRWISAAIPLLLTYAVLNLFLGSTSNSKDPVTTLRIFSGIWMLFYFLSFSLVLSFRRLSGRVL